MQHNYEKAIKKMLIWILICLLFPLSLQAQMQEGFVKTIGRPNRPGKPIAGVTIRLRGQSNAVVSNKQGHFYANMKDKREGDAIIIQNVQKKGFELNDREIIGRPFVFSSNVPIEIVMVNMKELAAIKHHIEEKAYQEAEKNYHNHLMELEKELKEKDLTEQQYQQQLQEIQNRYEKYQSLIVDMADRYARTDYDHIDSIDKKIYISIENGELEKADSLIHTVFDPNIVLARNRAAKAEVKAKMELAQQIIDKATNDLNAIKRDREYARRTAVLCENLAKEYLTEGNKVQAIVCLRKSLIIKSLLYGKQSWEVSIIQLEIDKLEKSNP